MEFPIGGHWSIRTDRLSRMVFEILSFKGIVVGSRDVIGHVTNGFPRCHFLLVVNTTDHVTRTVVEILSFKDIGVTTLTF